MATKGVVPGFEYDLFISYAHVSNADNWVAHFREDLEKQLRQHLPAAPTIWWDSTGLRGQALDAGIADAVFRSAVLVPIMSSAYLRSGYCVPKELAPFVAQEHEAFPLVVGTFKRLVVVGYDAEDDCPRATWPPGTHDAPFVSFCHRDVIGDRKLYDRRTLRGQYRTSLLRTVDHLTAVLLRLHQGPKGEAVAPPLAPSMPVAKPKLAWQQRWSRPLVYVRYRAVDTPMATRIANRIRQEQCDVTYIESDAGERALDAYLKRTDAEVLVFGCDVTDWAHMEWLRCREIARDGRPKRLGILAHGDCLDELGIESDFVVPLRLSESGDILGLDRLLEGLR